MYFIIGYAVIPMYCT